MPFSFHCCGMLFLPAFASSFPALRKIVIVNATRLQGLISPFFLCCCKSCLPMLWSSDANMSWCSVYLIKHVWGYLPTSQKCLSQMGTFSGVQNLWLQRQQHNLVACQYCNLQLVKHQYLCPLVLSLNFSSICSFFGFKTCFVLVLPSIPWASWDEIHYVRLKMIISTFFCNVAAKVIF